MAKAKIVVSSEEEEEEEDSLLESDSNDNGDIDAYDDVEDYKPHEVTRKAASQSRRKKVTPKSQEEPSEDEDEDDDDEDEEEEEEGDVDDESGSLSDDGEDYQSDTNFENELSDMNDDLEAKDFDEYDESEEPLKPIAVEKGKKSIKIKIKPPTKNKGRSSSDSTSSRLGSSRSTRKRQVNYYQEDEDNFSDLSEVEEPPQKTTKAVKIKSVVPPRKSRQPDLDPDLILTDEEEEYDPNAVNDVSKMTERQRARLNLDVSGATIEDPYYELDANGKKPKVKKVKEETEEEAALRKAENARKRQDYKNKILEEEKRDTLNKLLKRRATKSRETISEDKEGSVGVDEDSKSYYKERRATLNHPALVRYVNNTTSLNGNAVLAYK
ncbi:hypothetical protein KGF57_000239 [Candida theae]|uniref:INO80 complex subunit B-like conserved region domain-containing protein n=1 Tax=Candida theae TaxID=1198502 RepID=A0AAD5G0W7_9ASCO|nr:uncharacterized protein KGF57_000239 [Candida theae]KAI5968156.1 hypothetical protein KGF57_000239 [Candida theae]